jgi:hypothetical protein
MNGSQQSSVGSRQSAVSVCSRQSTMEISVECPYCGEPLELFVDPSGGSTQKYVEDCAVCCQPMEVLVEIEGDEDYSVSVRRFDD